jgi:hypothetical protein
MTGAALMTAKRNCASNLFYITEDYSIQTQTNSYRLHHRALFTLLEPSASQAVFKVFTAHDLKDLMLSKQGHEKVGDGGIIAGSTQVENVKGEYCYSDASASLGKMVYCNILLGVNHG